MELVGDGLTAVPRPITCWCMTREWWSSICRSSWRWRATPNGMSLLQWDCVNVCNWFVRQGFDCDAEALFAEAVGELY